MRWDEKFSRMKFYAEDGKTDIMISQDFPLETRGRKHFLTMYS